MADIQITKNDLQIANVTIDKKFVLINSSQYTEDAFAYLLEMVDQVGSVAFIQDTNKIWAQGRYFGGDTAKEDLHYWSQFIINNGEGGDIISVNAKSDDVLDIYADKLIKFTKSDDGKLFMNFDMANAVDESVFTFDSNSQYYLSGESGKVTMNKYTPIFMTISSLPVLAYESGDREVEIKFKFTAGSLPLSVFEPYSNPAVQMSEVSLLSTAISVIIPNNTDVDFRFVYGDTRSVREALTTQKWGYPIYYGSMEIAVTDQYINKVEDGKVTTTSYIDAINDMQYYADVKLPTKTVAIEQNGAEFGWVAMPSKWKPKFIDESTNTTGGWEKYSKFTKYPGTEYETEYQIWKTENSGLGYVKWQITSK